MNQHYPLVSFDQLRSCNHIPLEQLLQLGANLPQSFVKVPLNSTPLVVNTSGASAIATSREAIFNISSLTSPGESVATDEGYSSLSTPVLSAPRKGHHHGIIHGDQTQFPGFQWPQPITNKPVFMNCRDRDLGNRQSCLQTTGNAVGCAQQNYPCRLPTYPYFTDESLPLTKLSQANTFNADTHDGRSFEELNMERATFARPVQSGSNNVVGNAAASTDRSVYQQTFAHIRKEMISLIEMSMRELENYLKTSAEYNMAMKDIHINNEPLSMINRPQETSFSSRCPSNSCPVYMGCQTIQPLAREQAVSVHSNDNKPLPQSGQDNVEGYKQSRSPAGLKHGKPRRRRLRIRSSGHRVRCDQEGTRNRVLAQDTMTHTRLPLSPIKNIPDSGLDLRVRHEQSRVRYQAMEDTEGLAQKAKYTSLSASHLKRAKIMFMYARYPSSSLLKLHFPDVAFTRATTAQIVKWFSNFREFFYLQIEKYIRQCMTNGFSLKENSALTRHHELFRTLENHYNKDGEVESPYQFLTTTEVALKEFSRAISDNRDKEPGWKREVYRIIASRDCPFPEFVRSIN